MADQVLPPHQEPRPLLPGWTNNPIPNFSLSASGLIMLADLSTVAHRTALRGGSSWLDFLLLVPGLHYQQAADELANGGAAVLQAVEVLHSDKDGDGAPDVAYHTIVNRAVVSYIVRTAVEGKTVVLDVGEIPVRTQGWRMGTQGTMFGRGGRAGLAKGGGGGGVGDLPDLGWAAHLLYLASPVLTVIAATLIILLGDWWALALLIALMISRLLNIFVIKQRASPRPPPRIPLPPILTHPRGPEHKHRHARPPHLRITQYTVTVDPATRVILRGSAADLQALTTTVWLRPKTHVEGYLEAMAKVLVYLVAACSENATQAGNMVLLGLVLVSAGLLALSNAQTKGLRSGGRMVSPSTGEALLLRGHGGHVRGGGGGNNGIAAHGDVMRGSAGRGTVETWPESSDLSSLRDLEESVDKDYEGGLTRRACAGEGPVGHRVRPDTGLGRLEVINQRGREKVYGGMV
ncbi:hypothetical protein VPNG_02786 [Cytospora leucostoma]|uniref:Uncharacterized protein n=1 Tax=Cytospora leucostoma TaxID=1230097 RepID=A0A423XJ96_9PEZI|nr:hypothetical protein VPNG_02786 [Cytospora leucostoma]